MTKQENTILIPLIPIGDPHFEATVCYDLYAAGVSWGVIRDRYELAKCNSKQQIADYVRANGRKIYSPHNERTGTRGFEITYLSQIPDLPKFGESPEEYSERTGYPLDLAKTMSLWPSKPTEKAEKTHQEPEEEQP